LHERLAGDIFVPGFFVFRGSSSTKHEPSRGIDVMSHGRYLRALACVYAFTCRRRIAVKEASMQLSLLSRPITSLHLARRVVVLLLGVIVPAVVAQQTSVANQMMESSLLEKFSKRYPNVQDTATLMHTVEREANLGSPMSQTNLGILYLHGVGVPKDEAQAFRWFQRAAVERYPFAEMYMGISYYYGLGTASDQQEALRWFERSAKAGVPQAQAAYGSLLLRQDGAHKEAIHWLEKAAKKDVPVAEYLLGDNYDHPKDSAKPNYGKAAKLYEHAANQGLAPAQDQLARLYAAGRGVPKNAKLALELETKAASQGYTYAYMPLAILKMSPDAGPVDNAAAYKWYLTAAHTDAALVAPSFRNEFAIFALKLTQQQREAAESAAQVWIAEHPVASPTDVMRSFLSAKR
jgi:TPR repeat protein